MQECTNATSSQIFNSGNFILLSVISDFKYNLFKTDSAYPAPIIVDGVIQENTLKNIRKNKIWIKLYLRNQNINLEDIFYAFYKNGKIYTILKSNVNNL